MINYDFHTLLEPLKFQSLACDIIEVREGLSLESYKAGKDQGIDGFYKDQNTTCVVQVKRYKQDFQVLFRDLKKELEKVKSIMPTRYILAVSLSLSKSEKDKIYNLFSPYIQNTSDILGRQDLNHLLSQEPYKYIEISHPKLWLPSINVFREVLNKEIHSSLYKESEFELKEALQMSKLFVQTRTFGVAAKKMYHHNIVILSGEPGIGKTVMAQMLALAHLHTEEASEFIWAKSIDDIITAYDENKTQAFILDDFWGAIFYNEQPISRNNESRFEKIVRRIIQSNGKQKLILTTREYVLQQGLEYHPSLRKLIKQYSLVCTLEEYSDSEKSRIMFSHLYNSDLNYDKVGYIFHECDSIIYHENYNPRVLAQFLHSGYDKGLPAEEYFDMLLEYLDDPSDFWEQVFVELSEEARIVAMLLFISSTPMLQEYLETCYQKYIYGNPAKKSLSDCIAELEQTLIRTYYLDDWQMLSIWFLSPAIQDFLYEYMKKNSEQYIPIILNCICFYNQYLFLLEHQCSAYSKRLTDEIIKLCIRHYEDLNDCYSYEPDDYYIDNIYDDNDSGDLNRFFIMFRANERIKSLELQNFLEQKINQYCQTMGAESYIEKQYNDLWNLPGYLVQCTDSRINIHMDKLQLIQKYYDSAFSIHHYSKMKEFAKIYPTEFEAVYQKVYPQIKKGLKQKLIDELFFLEEEGMFPEFDILLDSIPGILEEYGLKYTKTFGKRLLSLFQREPESIVREQEKLNASSDKEKRIPRDETIDLAKQEAVDWLFGPRELNYNESEEDSFDNEMKALVGSSNLNCSQKKQLWDILTEGPPYIREMFHSEQALHLLRETLQSLDTTYFIVSEKYIFLAMIENICKNNRNRISSLISCCAESLKLFCNCSEPVIRRHEFYESDAYKIYLQEDTELEKVFSENFILLDEQWVRFLHIPLFLFCFAAQVIAEGEDSLKYVSDLIWEDTAPKYKFYSKERRGKYILFTDFGGFMFQNLDWEHCLCRMFEFIHPYRYNQEILEPMLRKYWKQLGDGEFMQKGIRHLKQNQIRLEFDDEGNLVGGSCSPDPGIFIFDYLGIDMGTYFGSASVSQSLLERLKANEQICFWSNHRNDWEVKLHEIEEPDLLEEMHITEELQIAMRKIEYFIHRFQEGNYSIINGEEDYQISTKNDENSIEAKE